MLSSSDVNTGLLRVRALEREGNVPGLMRELENRAEDTALTVRGAAAHALRRLADPTAAPSLARLLDDHNEDVRIAAVRALGDVGGPHASEPLERALHDSSPAARWWAAVGLAKLRHPAAFGVLLKLLEDDHHNTRRGAAVWLGNLGDARAVEPLTRTKRRERWWRRRQHRQALRQLRATRGGGP
jgi:HEAT repeat protein